MAELHKAIATVDHAAIELILTRKCADVAKFSYSLRCAGDRISDGVLDNFDSNARATVEQTLGGPLPDTGWWQATTGVVFGGLGLREAKTVSLPAVLASRITARPLAMEMAEHAARAGLVTLQQFERAYDARTRAAFERLSALLPAGVRDDLRVVAEEGAEAAAVR